jgi:hypothetical protein
MCNRQCLCKICKNGGCGRCKYFNQKQIEQCRLDGVDKCKHYKTNFKGVLKSFLFKVYKLLRKI